MKQIFQNLKSGETFLEDVPIPSIDTDEILLKTSFSLISQGTENMLIQFGKSNIIKKVIDNKDKVDKVLDKVKTDGVTSTLNAVNAKLNKDVPLGYSNIGKVIEIGSNVNNFKIGDRVLTNGFHAEYVKSKKNLAIKIHDELKDEEAVFGIIGSVALQSIRLLKPSLGENIVVMGAGLLGILTAQILKANSCNVLLADINKERLNIAEKLKIDVINTNQDNIFSKSKYLFNDGIVDGVIIAANTKSDTLIKNSANLLRKRGRIILSGVSGLNLNRDDFYKKEISIQVSSSYGPGRYEKNYEEKNMDYPVGFVRWTENRNFSAFIKLLSEKKISTKSLITKVFEIDEYKDAYKLIGDKTKFKLGVLIKYRSDNNKNIKKNIFFANQNKKIDENKINVGIIGSGNFIERTLLPIFNKLNVNFISIGSKNSISSSLLGKKYSFNQAVSNAEDVIRNEEVNTIVIGTRHDTHYKYLIQAMKANKNIFLEKPLCLNYSELHDIKELYYSSYIKTGKIMYVDFNRRFSSLINEMKNTISSSLSPKNFIITINAGIIEKDNWLLNLNEGGGRLIGEACHFIDLLIYLNNSDFDSFKISSIDKENFSIILKFKDGSNGTIHYFSNGPMSFPKERIEVFYDEKVIQVDNFKSLKSYGSGGMPNKKLWSQDKGHLNIVKSFIDSINGSKTPEISFKELFDVSDISIRAANKL